MVATQLNLNPSNVNINSHLHIPAYVGELSLLTIFFILEWMYAQFALSHLINFYLFVSSVSIVFIFSFSVF
jgi:hypothetical protein